MGQVVRIMLAVVGLLAVSLTSEAAKQDQGMPVFTAEWHPALGAGGAYLTQTAGQQPMTWEMSVVGREGDGYWIEMYLPQMKTVMKSLTSPRGVSHIIVKTEGQPAMEMPASFMGEAPKMYVKETGEHLGQEQVATPAGTFTCEHYRVTERSGPADVWVATDVSPYGLVKMTSPEVTMMLQRVITGATTRITETPQKFEMPQMPNMPGGMEKLLNGMPGMGTPSGGRGRPSASSQQQQMPDMSALMQALQQQTQ